MNKMFDMMRLILYLAFLFMIVEPTFGTIINKVILEYGDASSGFAQRRRVVEYRLYDGIFCRESLNSDVENDIPLTIPSDEIQKMYQVVLKGMRKTAPNIKVSDDEIQMCISIVRDSDDIDVENMLLLYEATKEDCIKRIESLLEKRNFLDGTIPMFSPEYLFRIKLYSNKKKIVELCPRSCYEGDSWIVNDNRYIDEGTVIPFIKSMNLDTHFIQEEKRYFIIRAALAR